MRLLMLAFTTAASLFIASAALAAPTCLDKNGDTIRCGTPGAMPMGWTLSTQQLLDRQMSKPIDSSINELLRVICGLGVFFTMIALMPEFDGSHAEDWDKQEEDDEERG
jgi:hypothetical protein